MTLMNKHLLVVDDNSVNIELLLDLLDDHGFDNVHGLSDPRHVLAYCQQQLPDLILLDIRMPHIDGYAVMEQLQEHFADQTPPVIVLTAQIDDDTRHRALKMGIRDFLTKPFKHDEVLQRIRNTLDVEHRYQVRDKQAETLEQMVAKRTEELDHQSRTDPITQLPNRRALTQLLQEAAQRGHGTGLLFIALDHLDDAVRLHGYGIADQLIMHISHRLNAQLSPKCTLGLWGGSELLVITQSAELTGLRQLASRLLSCFDHDQTLGDLLLPLNARMGISWSHGHFETERLVHMAALALPQNGSLRIQNYNETLETQQRHRLHLQQAVRGATQRGDILSIGEWVLEEAMRYIVQWRQQGLLNDRFHIAVNVAARQLARKDFAQNLLTRLAKHNIPERFFALEVTESGLLSDMHNARIQLAQLTEAKIAVAIDDFGTGHSSLAYVKTLPFSTLKIDRAFVLDLEKDTVDRQLALTITQLAHAVGCNVVAEGIETAAQADYLRSIGCEAAQGYYYARPLPADEFYRWCTNWKPHPNLTPATESVNGA